MKRLLGNVYLYIFGVPAMAFAALVALSVNTDHINIVGRIVAAVLVGYIAARYIWRSVALVAAGDTAPEAFNLVGWSSFLVAYIFSTVYGAIYIIMDRPVWLSSLYFNSAFVVLAAVGAAMVAWSIPRVGIFPNDQRGASSLVAFLVGGICMFTASHLPQLASALRGLFSSISHAL